MAGAVDLGRGLGFAVDFKCGLFWGMSISGSQELKTIADDDLHPLPVQAYQ
uniref:Uncharacterized protein n=1 Tax=Tetraselmis sp. GSL018 TaxID=582737 RepID=A0A061RRF4_9CHLO|eukprot:CAMPEP_0177623658 /NCGR_PEP_ID=MMETSP0419_2-20121207/29019_1 /TAXON_ID=582737 /ORGANISM="Tetraselmis sp., Strain GSL018" /LENGTH=50 /DNA_ID=CAMNT_0019124223 /DNA_START=357 /DNA_END=509 /DNA_ORIENTATION=-